VLLFSDCVWLALVTAATIGFGDFYPSTHCGRTAAVISAFAGITIQALLVGIASSKIKMNAAEYNFYRFCNEKTMDNELKKQAAICLQRLFRQKMRNRALNSKTLSNISESHLVTASDPIVGSWVNFKKERISRESSFGHISTIGLAAETDVKECLRRLETAQKQQERNKDTAYALAQSLQQLEQTVQKLEVSLRVVSASIVGQNHSFPS